eukprot:1006860-Prorocentrum_lima.AAC.1
MTSSLVGSEMCIRDRWRSVHFQTSPCDCVATMMTVRATSVTIHCRVGVAVSYTHLTLPTICSV